MTYRANWFWQIKVTTVTSCLTGSKAVVELPLYQAGVQPGIRERLIGMFIKNAISLKIYFSNSKIIAVSLPGMKRRLSIFMPLFHLPVFWFGYFDGFKTLSSLLQECARSGKNKREWCAQAGVKYSTLMRWQGLLRDELAGEILSGQEIVPVQIQKPGEEVLASKSSADCCADEAGTSGICIEKGEVRIYLPADVPIEYLVKLVKGLA